MSERIRVRFAPSPTGFLHVGNVRTALFNWLFARHRGGTMVLRIEDTDILRSEDRYEPQLLDDLRWLGLDWDEGPDKGGGFAPYRQSERYGIYREHTARLLEHGHAYYCFCTSEQLEEERQTALKSGQQPRYSGRCRSIPREESARRVSAGERAAIRLGIEEGNFAWDDLVHGPVAFASEVIGDFILVRSDGHPTYNYTVVIDDHLMEISHVIRGDDHISNTPRQLAVYLAFGWDLPRFGHLSTILGPDRTRLSKRHGAASIESFQAMGVLPEALRNYLALLGWSAADGITEIMSAEQLVTQFSLEHVNKAPAVFDQQKLLWMNRHYMKEAPLRRVARLSVPFFKQAGYLASDSEVSDPVLAWLGRVLEAFLKNLDTLSQLPEAARLIFEYDAPGILSQEDGRQVVEDPGSLQVLEAFIPKVLAFETVTYERFRESAKAVQKETGKKGKDLFHPIRVALTGAASGPELEKLIPIFEEGARLSMVKPLKDTRERLREFAAAAGL